MTIVIVASRQRVALTYRLVCSACSNVMKIIAAKYTWATNTGGATGGAGLCGLKSRWRGGQAERQGPGGESLMCSR